MLVRGIRLFFLSAISFLVTSLPLLAVAEKKGFEPTPVFQASQILPAEVVAGPHHRLQEEVRNDGYMNHFIIESPFGTYQVVGVPMLERRIHEINALGVLAENSSTRVAIDTGRDVGNRIASSSVDATRRLGQTLSNPSKLGETVRSIPGGVANLFGVAADTVSTGVGVVTETVSGEGEGGGEGGSSSSSVTSRATDRATSAALRHSGYSGAWSRWAKELEIDPHTDNELLLSEISRVARVEAGASFGTRALVPSPRSLPGVSEANRWLDRMENISLYDDPEKIASLNDRIMRSLGVGEREIRLFIDNPHYTPTTRTLLLGGINAMEDVENSAELFQLAATVGSSEAAWYFVFAIQQLVKSHEENPFEEVISAIALPAAVTPAGHLLIPMPVDHLVWTEDVAEILSRAHQRAISHHKVSSKELQLRGTVSKRTRQELQQLGFSVTENYSLLGADEPVKQ